MLGYDSAGNVSTWPGYMGGTATYTYDAENHLTQVAVPSGSFTYTYDGDGRPVPGFGFQNLGLGLRSGSGWRIWSQERPEHE